MQEEIWKDISGYDGKYQISNMGNVRHFYKNGKMNYLKPCLWGRYFTVDLCTPTKEGRKHNCQSIHRLVALHFIPNPTNADTVNHIDGNEKNNNVNNLEWCTDKENLDHAITKLKHYPFGKKPKAVKKLTLNGELVAEYTSIGRAVDSVIDTYPSANRSHISNCCNHIIPSAYGYKWEYSNE